jgi:signal transduction histidine kinase/ActR/RegA family two-component response regulator
MSKIATPLGFVLTATVVIANATSIAVNVARIMHVNRSLDRTGDLINELEHARSLLRDAESARRGDLLTGSAAESSRYEAATDELARCMDGLVKLAAGDPDQVRRVARLRQAVDVRLEALHRLKPAGLLHEADANFNRYAMEEALRRVAEVWDATDDIIDAQVAARDAAVVRAEIELAAFTGLALLLLAAAWLLSRREIAMRQRAGEAERAARESAQAANRAKDRMLAVIGHELRAPLAPVLMEVSTLLRQGDHPELRPTLETIRGHIELEVRLVDDLIDLALLEQGRLRLERRPVDVHEVIRRAIEVCRGLRPAESLRLELELRARKHWVDGDATRLEQVLWNLLRNAVDHVLDGGRVTVRTRDEPPEDNTAGTLAIEVADDGVGILGSDLARIFEAFERGGRAGRPGGLGLGLAIARQLTEAHGGRILATSAGTGRGATFVVRLPPIERILGDPPPPPIPVPLPDPAALRVLLVEDHVATREAIERALRRQGYQVRSVGRVAEAVNAANGYEFGILLSDIELPDGSGLELMSLLRGRGVRGIALSGYATEDDRRLSIEAGFTEHLAKPVTIDALEAAMRRVAAGAAFEESLAEVPTSLRE